MLRISDAANGRVLRLWILRAPLWALTQLERLDRAGVELSARARVP